MLETIREFGLEQLAASGELPAMQQAHATYCLDLAERAEPELQGAGQAGWFDRLEREQANFRAVLELGPAHAVDGEPVAARLAAALWRFWDGRGHLTEGRAWLKRLTATPARTATYAKLLNAAGILAFRQGDLAEALRHHEASLALSREIGNQSGLATTLNNLGNVAWAQGDYATARARYQASLAIDRERGHRPGIALALLNIGTITSDLGDLAAARADLAESLAIMRDLGNHSGTALVLNNLALVAEREEDWPRTAELLRESLSIYRHVGHREGIGMALYNLATAERHLGNLVAAARGLAESLELAVELGLNVGIVHLLAGTGDLALGEQHPVEAARLFGATEALRERLGMDRNLPPVERDHQLRRRTDLDAALGPDRAADLWRQGRALTTPEAAAEAQHLLSRLGVPGGTG